MSGILPTDVTQAVTTWHWASVREVKKMKIEGIKHMSVVRFCESRNITLLLTSVTICLLSVSLESLFSFVKRAIFSYILCPTVTVNITTFK